MQVRTAVSIGYSLRIAHASVRGVLLLLQMQKTSWSLVHMLYTEHVTQAVRMLLPAVPHACHVNLADVRQGG